MEINLLLRITDLDELDRFTAIMRTFPALSKTLNFEKAADDWQKKIEALRAETVDLQAQIEAKKRELMQQQPQQLSPNAVSQPQSQPIM